MVIAGGGAAGHKKFGEREAHREAEDVAIQMARPNGIERLEPAEELFVDGVGMGAGERLVKMVMGVDEAGENDVARGVECFITGRGRAGGADQFSDATVFDDQSSWSR